MTRNSNFSFHFENFQLIELDPKNPIWHLNLGQRLRLIKNKAFHNGHRYEPSTEEFNCFVIAYNLRPDVPRFFAMLSRGIAEMLKVKGVESKDQAFEVNVQRIETVADAINFLRKFTR